MANCFVIHNSDGDTTVRKMDTERLEQELARGSYGESPLFLKDIRDTDTNYWEKGGYLVIVGEIVVPTPVETVTKWSVRS